MCVGERNNTRRTRDRTPRSVCPSVWLSVCLAVRLSVCLSVRLSGCPSVCLSVFLFVFQSASQSDTITWYMYGMCDFSVIYNQSCLFLYLQESVKSKQKSACPRRPICAQPLRPRDQFPANTALYITIRHINMLSGS